MDPLDKYTATFWMTLKGSMPHLDADSSRFIQTWMDQHPQYQTAMKPYEPMLIALYGDDYWEQGKYITNVFAEKFAVVSDNCSLPDTL